MIVDLHGAEVRKIPRERPPVTVGASSTIGLVGSAPDARIAVAAAVTLGAGDAAVTAMADVAGAAGNTISLALLNPQGNNQALAVTVDDRAISVELATDANGLITTTATELAVAVNADAVASALLTLAAQGTGAGVVAVAPPSLLAGGLDEAFPINTPVLLITASQAAALGTAGELAAAVRDVYRTAGAGGAAIVVVRTADDTAATLAGSAADKTGIYALLGAESHTGQRPRLIAAPGAKDASVSAALEAVAADLRAVGVITVAAASVADAVTAAPALAHLYALWPSFVIVDAGLEVTRPADALVLGHIARIDREFSFATSPSNHLLRGVIRTSQPIGWTIDSRTSEANTLNRANLTTAIRRGAGVWLWGNRVSDGTLISKLRADELINDRLLDVVLDYLDRNVDLPFVEHVVGRMNAYIRTLVVARRIRSGRAWFDGAHNSAATLAASMVTFSFELLLFDVAEHIVIRSSVASVPDDVVAQLTGI